MSSATLSESRATLPLILLLCTQMRGVQIGLFNMTDTMHGLQVGVANIIRTNKIPFLPIVNWSF